MNMEIRDRNGKVIGAASGDPEWIRKTLAEMQSTGAVDETAKARPELKLVPKDDPA